MNERQIKFPKKNIARFKHVELKDKKWILTEGELSLRCAYCWYIQLVHLVRENDSDTTKDIIIGIALGEQEDHSPGCPQLTKL